MVAGVAGWGVTSPHSPVVSSPCPATHPGFQWSGCSDNIAYGVAFSQSFVDARMRSRGLIQPGPS